ncbi:ANE_G0040440.mRNA.1.CDS.1 [Saccharomyces cerevisiae]|nr:ANE_G0040440.mRNA.1.CDS.1 [Saccharomyces cerevisiae]CAI6834125.1 ANE_G0040440.mRNA.1.CDS.1 [Saccharomyces cerevisiae]
MKKLSYTGFEICGAMEACRNLSKLITSLQETPGDDIGNGRFPEGYEINGICAAKNLHQRGLFITNLSGVSLAWRLLHVEFGNLRTIWKDFEVNFDLKNLHCGGRSANLLCPPTMASLKFSQLFKIPTNGLLHSIPQMIQQQQPRLPEEEYRRLEIQMSKYR